MVWPARQKVQLLVDCGRGQLAPILYEIYIFSPESLIARLTLVLRSLDDVEAAGFSFCGGANFSLWAGAAEGDRDQFEGSSLHLCRWISLMVVYVMAPEEMTRLCTNALWAAQISVLTAM